MILFRGQHDSWPSLRDPGAWKSANHYVSGPQLLLRSCSSKRNERRGSGLSHVLIRQESDHSIYRPCARSASWLAQVKTFLASLGGSARRRGPSVPASRCGNHFPDSLDHQVGTVQMDHVAAALRPDQLPGGGQAGQLDLLGLMGVARAFTALEDT